MRCAESTAGRLRRALLVLLPLAALCACSALRHPAPGAAQGGSVAAGGQGAPAAAPPAPVPAAGAGAAPAGDSPAPAAPPPVDPAVQASFDAALAALQQGRAEQAQQAFGELASAHPELGGPHANLGILHRKAGRIEQAVAELELATRAGPAQPVYWNQLGIAYRQQGRFDKAREAYERAISLDPKYAMPRLNLGVLFDLYLWDEAKALEQYEGYLALTPAGDEKVSKWVADLRNRNRAKVAGAAPAAGKEQQ
jgi:tetratricopeptide (TPR) repeat protein